MPAASISGPLRSRVSSGVFRRRAVFSGVTSRERPGGGLAMAQPMCALRHVLAIQNTPLRAS